MAFQGHPKDKKRRIDMLSVTNTLLHGIENPSFVRHDNTLARPYISYGAADRVDVLELAIPNRLGGGSQTSLLPPSLLFSRSLKTFVSSLPRTKKEVYRRSDIRGEDRPSS
jgi:hypothetical protein